METPTLLGPLGTANLIHLRWGYGETIPLGPLELSKLL
jgi:hypothetical protein